MISIELPPETTPEELIRSNVVKEEQLKVHQQVQQKQLDDFSEFLAKKQKRLEEWEQQLTQKDYALNAETGYLGVKPNG